MTGCCAVEEDRVGIVNDLIESEALVMCARSKEARCSLVADLELRGLRDGVVVRHPDEMDGITNGSVHSEGNISENTLGRGNNNCVCGSSPHLLCSGGSETAEGSHTFYGGVLLSMRVSDATKSGDLR